MSGFIHAKLTPETVREARVLAALGISDAALAARYGVSGISVWAAVTGRTYKRVPGALVKGRSHCQANQRSLEPWQAAQAYYDFWKGRRSAEKIGRAFGVNMSVIYHLVYGNTYRDATRTVNLDV